LGQARLLSQALDIIPNPKQTNSILVVGKIGKLLYTFGVTRQLWGFQFARADQSKRDMLATQMTADDGTQKVVCILGMHRSGTSGLTGIINLLGVDLGPHEALALEAAEDNTKGHWEHKEIALINEEILSAYGGSWHEPPALPRGWQTSTLLDDLRARARKLIHEQFENVSLWGWKDPRTCLTLPFWQQFVSNPYYVLCLRNPLDVASSLARRNQFLLHLVRRMPHGEFAQRGEIGLDEEILQGAPRFLRRSRTAELFRAGPHCRSTCRWSGRRDPSMCRCFAA